MVATLTREALSASGISYAIGGVRILDDVELRVQVGEMVGVVGPNGAGKTTLLRALSGLVRARGMVVLQDHALVDLDEDAVARLAARVPQAMVSDNAFVAEEVVLMGRTPHLGRWQWETAHDRAVAAGAMRATATAHFANRLVADLSGGERQRVFVARALAQEAPILLLDEPTANLDIGHQVQTLALVRRLLTDGMCAIAAIHDLELASRFCDRIVLLHEGRVLDQGTPGDVLTPANLRAAYGVKALVERHPHVPGLRITVLESIGATTE